MRRLSTRQLITSFLVKDRDMSADMLMHELAKHGLNLPKLVTGHFRSTIRAVLLYLIDQGLLNLVELKTEDEFGLQPEHIATTCHLQRPGHGRIGYAQSMILTLSPSRRGARKLKASRVWSESLDDSCARIRRIS